MTAVAYVTAQSADVKVINRFLLHIRDWEYGDDPQWDVVSIVRPKPLTGSLPKDLAADVPPLQSFSDNQWLGTPLEDIERSLFAPSDSGDGLDGTGPSLFLVLDDQGVRDQTVIVAKRGVNDGGGPLYTNFIRKVRVPWDQAYLMWCNLNIANMDFEDFCDQEKGPDWGHWWTHSAEPTADAKTAEEIKRKRDAALKELEKLDLA